jgi:hypothetical protein
MKDDYDRIALFDLDGVLANYEGGVENSVKINWKGEVPENLDSEDISQELKQKIREWRTEKGWWFKLKPIQSGIELVKICKKIGFRIHILTQVPKDSINAWSEKYEWCERYIKPIDPEYTLSITRGGKGLHYGRVFVDDWPPFMESWINHRPRGVGIMPDKFCNKDYSHKNIIKFDPQKTIPKKIVEVLKKAYERKPFEEL